AWRAQYTDWVGPVDARVRCPPLFGTARRLWADSPSRLPLRPTGYTRPQTPDRSRSLGGRPRLPENSVLEPRPVHPCHRLSSPRGEPCASADGARLCHRCLSSGWRWEDREDGPAQTVDLLQLSRIPHG